MQIGSMSWRELEGRMASGAPPAVLVPLGAVEAHGPHLPLETDTIIAVNLAQEVAGQLEKAGVEALCAPPVPLSAASWAADFPGTVSLDEEAERGVLTGVLAALRGARAARVALVNVHFDPAHVGVVRTVVEAGRAGGMDGLVFTDFTRRRHAQRIGGEFASGACHGGEFETSMVLAADPEKVQPAYRDLPAVDLDLAAAIREGKKSFREVGLHEAYCGNPASASVAEGKRLYRLLAEIVAEECLAAWGPGQARPP